MIWLLLFCSHYKTTFSSVCSTCRVEMHSCMSFLSFQKIFKNLCKGLFTCMGMGQMKWVSGRTEDILRCKITLVNGRVVYFVDCWRLSWSDKISANQLHKISTKVQHSWDCMCLKNIELFFQIDMADHPRRFYHF